MGQVATMTEEHKEALAVGRTEGRFVRVYLEALVLHKPRRGRRPNVENVQARIAEVTAAIDSGVDPIKRLHLIQQRKELQEQTGETETADEFAEKEADFIKVAASYGARKGIEYATWREAGVSAEVLRAAGVPRSGI